MVPVSLEDVKPESVEAFFMERRERLFGESAELEAYWPGGCARPRQVGSMQSHGWAEAVQVTNEVHISPARRDLQPSPKRSRAHPERCNTGEPQMAQKPLRLRVPASPTDHRCALRPRHSPRHGENYGRRGPYRCPSGIAGTGNPPWRGLADYFITHGLAGASAAKGLGHRCTPCLMSSFRNGALVGLPVVASRRARPLSSRLPYCGRRPRSSEARNRNERGDTRAVCCRLQSPGHDRIQLRSVAELDASPPRQAWENRRFSSTSSTSHWMVPSQAPAAWSDR